MKAIEVDKKLNNIFSDKKRAINEDTLKSICRIGEGQNTCRYIMRDRDNYVCVKNSVVQVTIDSMVEKGGMIARGDNCSGLTTQEELLNEKEVQQEKGEEANSKKEDKDKEGEKGPDNPHEAEQEEKEKSQN